MLDLAVISDGMAGIAIMAYGRIIVWGEDSARFDIVFGAGILVTMFAVVGAVQVKLIEVFFAAIRWINRRDDPRHQKPPSEPP
ncbi:MAG TPA: hypothetical protein VGH74_13260 [Planctomycetaceae bacterium]|jgi:hypothetical protein